MPHLNRISRNNQDFEAPGKIKYGEVFREFFSEWTLLSISVFRCAVKLYKNIIKNLKGRSINNQKF